MMGAWAATLMLLTAASAGIAQYYVEADLNGVVGDPQPDYLVTTVGEEVLVDYWVLGSTNPALAYWLPVCNFDHSLGYLSTLYYPTPGGCWTSLPVAPPDSAGCILLSGANHTFGVCPLIPPYRVATVTYQAAADGSIAELHLGDGSGVLTYSFITHD
ncbi:MAG: hypothetical protein ABIH26_14655, partial [Candidatus Eisenbacteria bacterium]